jgi:hypothetical protein
MMAVAFSIPNAARNSESQKKDWTLEILAGIGALAQKLSKLLRR